MQEPKVILQYDLESKQALIQYQDVANDSVIDVMWLDKQEWEIMKGKINGLFKGEE